MHRPIQPLLQIDQVPIEVATALSFLYFIFTNDCNSKTDTVTINKFAGDTAVTVFISESNQISFICYFL